jgi:hypothetical protein
MVEGREFEGSLAFCFRQEITRRRTTTCRAVHKILLKTTPIGSISV